MKIRADKEGVEVITQLLDLALRHGGIKNLEITNKIAQAVEEIEEPEPIKVPRKVRKTK